LDNIASTIANPKGALTRIFPKTAELDKERKDDTYQRDIDGTLKCITAEGKADSEQIVQELETIKKLKNKYATNPQARQEIAQAVQNILSREHKVDQILNEITQLITVDYSLNSDALRKKMDDIKKLKGDERELGNSPEFKELENLAKADEKNEFVERVNIQIVRQLQQQALDYKNKFEEILRDALIRIKLGQEIEANYALDDAIKEEKKRGKLFQKMQRYERILRRLNLRELREEKKEVTIISKEKI